MNTERILYFPTVEAGRGLLDAVAEHLLTRMTPLKITTLDHAKPLPEPEKTDHSQRNPQFEDELDQWESQISGGFRVGHPIERDDPKEWVSEDILIFRMRAECPLESSPYYRMNQDHKDGEAIDVQALQMPLTSSWLFQQGVESIHVQPQYAGVPGYWLDVRCSNRPEGLNLLTALDCMSGREVETPPTPSPPLPEHFPFNLLNTVEGIARLLAAGNYEPYADTLCHILQILSQIRPREFHGDLIYVWEELMRHYTTINDLDKAVFCLEAQAGLDPTSSDPWLNLGFVYNSFNHPGKALETYLEGVQRFPQDEYLHHNLASLLLNLGHHTKALHFLNEAILVNPDRAVNFKLKGDIHATRQVLYLAMAAYQQAVLLLTDGEPAWFRQTCIESLALCFDEEGMTDNGAKLRQLSAAGGNVKDFVRQTRKGFCNNNSHGRKKY